MVERSEFNIFLFIWIYKSLFGYDEYLKIHAIIIIFENLSPILLIWRRLNFVVMMSKFCPVQNSIQFQILCQNLFLGGESSYVSFCFIPHTFLQSLIRFLYISFFIPHTKKSELKHNIDFIKIRKTNISFIWVCSTISEENTQRTKNKSQGKHTDWWTMKSNLEVPLKSNKMSTESTFPVLSKTRFSFHLATWIDDSDYPKFVVIQLFYCCWIVLLYECFDCGEK